MMLGLSPERQFWLFFKHANGTENTIELAMVMPILDTHTWAHTIFDNLYVCSECGAFCVQSGEEIYFFSNEDRKQYWQRGLEPAEYPIDCKTNTIKQVIQ